MSKILSEAITVDNAELIGTANGYDVFDIKTYAAAEQFNIEDRDDSAGQAYVHDEPTFNSNINDSQHLYFFVRQNTNKVFGGVVKSDSTSSNLQIKNSNGKELDLRVNFLFENAAENSNSCNQERILPFFLIPGAKVSDNESSRDDVIVINNTLVAALKNWNALDSVEILDTDDLSTVSAIKSEFATYGLKINRLIIGDSVNSIESNSMDNVDEIKVKQTEKPEGWDNNWNSRKEDQTQWGYGLSEEELAALQAEKEEARKAEEERIERERAEEEARIAREKELAEMSEIQKLRYKIEGNEITIKGVKKGVSELDIPEEIDGKPVTKIEAFAFYDNKDLKEVKLPNTLKLIEQGAFDETDLRYTVWAPKNCIIGKNNGTQIRK